MDPQQFRLRWNSHQSNMLVVFEQLLSIGALVDVTLICEGLSWKAHKMVLSACSDFFRDTFIENPSKHPIVILKDIRKEDLSALIDFMYRGEVSVSRNDLPSLLKAADTLKIKGLSEMTGERSEENVNKLVQETIQKRASKDASEASSSGTVTMPMQLDNNLRVSNVKTPDIGNPNKAHSSGHKNKIAASGASSKTPLLTQDKLNKSETSVQPPQPSHEVTEYALPLASDESTSEEEGEYDGMDVSTLLEQSSENLRKFEIVPVTLTTSSSGLVTATPTRPIVDKSCQSIGSSLIQTTPAETLIPALNIASEHLYASTIKIEPTDDTTANDIPTIKFEVSHPNKSSTVQLPSSNKPKILTISSTSAPTIKPVNISGRLGPTSTSVQSTSRQVPSATSANTKLLDEANPYPAVSGFSVLQPSLQTTIQHFSSSNSDANNPSSTPLHEYVAGATSAFGLGAADSAPKSHKAKKIIKVNKAGVPQPKRATTAYINFTMCYRQQIKSSGQVCPRIGQFGKDCAQKWNSMSAAEKAPFQKIAESDKKRYRQEMQVYKPPRESNRPKRPGTAFMFFMSDFRKLMAGRESGGRVSALAVLGAQKWGEMTEDERSSYMKMQEDEKIRYYSEMREYRRANALALVADFSKDFEDMEQDTDDNFDITDVESADEVSTQALADDDDDSGQPSSTDDVPSQRVTRSNASTSSQSSSPKTLPTSSRR